MAMDTSSTARELFLQDSQMANNRSIRILICLCIDCSISMQISGAIQEISAGVTAFLKKVDENFLARDAAEICLVTFGNEAKVLCEFGSAEAALKQLAATPIAARDSETSLAAGVQLALDQIEDYRQRLSSVNNNCYTPWLIIISDGDSSELDRVVRQAADRVQHMLRTFKLKTMCLSMGDGTRSLNDFSIDGKVDRLENMVVSKFFDNLSRNVSQASRDTVEHGGMDAPTDWH